MSLDLLARLQKYGLKVKWLYYLNTHGIHTFEDLKSKEVWDILANIKKKEKITSDEEDAFNRLFSKDFPSPEEKGRLQTILMNEDHALAITNETEAETPKKPEVHEAKPENISQASAVSSDLDLPTCLQKCGLQNKWLFILDEHGIETYEDLQSAKEDLHLIAKIKKEASKAEKVALRQLFSDDFPSPEKRRRSVISLMNEDQAITKYAEAESLIKPEVKTAKPGNTSEVCLDLITSLLRRGLKNIFDEQLQSAKENMDITAPLKKGINKDEEVALRHLFSDDSGRHLEERPKITSVNNTLRHHSQRNAESFEELEVKQTCLKTMYGSKYIEETVYDNRKTTPQTDSNTKFSLTNKHSDENVRLAYLPPTLTPPESMNNSVNISGNACTDTKIIPATVISSFSGEETKQVNAESCDFPEATGRGNVNILKSENTQSNSYNIIKMLGLCDYYPKKITVEMVMQKSTDKLDQLEDIPWYVLQKLLMLDYRGRNVNCLKIAVPDRDGSSSNKAENGKNTYSSDAFTKSFLEKVKNELPSVNNSSLPHPLDTIVAIFLCSSDFLRQTLSEKMYMCHLSIPFLLPDNSKSEVTYLLWALRSIISEWELSEGASAETHIVNYELPIVSFLRFGEVFRSKSKLMNEIISSKGHHTFFHKDLSSGVMPPVLANGLAEVTWFFPSKGTESKLDEAVTFINLHGNSTTFSKQRQFLQKISNVLVVLISTKELQSNCFVNCLEECLNKKKNVVIVICESSFSMTHLFESMLTEFIKKFEGKLDLLTFICDFYGTQSKTTKELTSEIINAILQYLKCENKISLQMSQSISAECNIPVDDHDEENKSGRTLALEVFQHIDSDRLDYTKATQLCLQGDLWHEWGKWEKEGQRSKEKVTEYDSAEVHQKKTELRERQLEICNNPSDLFNSFMSCMTNTKGNTKIYFLRWLSLYMDEASRKSLPKVLKDYKEAWNEIDIARNEKDKPHDMEGLQTKLSETETKLAMTSLGLEHLIREMSQAFEVVSSLSDKCSEELKSRVEKYPRIMAELMIAGYPLELMDGEASHIPLSWVTAVLSELNELIEDRKVFVLSVVGVQSSGKSTLLNTMFSLHFAVSAGRCTQGVYAQLIRVPDSGSPMPFDYILVVDSEGLRAPERCTSKYSHDNELATFVIGLADMTLINIKGENSPEMQDFLQITVHAFLRMIVVNKSLKLQPSCFFLHQNVASISACDKMIFGQHKLEENLDTMTAAAAYQENYSEICSFTEVINFDSKKNIWYFSDLWQGDPPMAPINPGYSDKVCRVKQAIIDEAMKRKRGYSKLSDISIRIKDLWKAILGESFVFSYKNTLEVRAYSFLESTLNNMFWKLQNCALEWFAKQHNIIMSAESQLDDLGKELSEDFSEYISDEHAEEEKKLLQFFETYDNREIIEQWKETSTIKLKKKKDELCTSTINDIKNDANLRKLQLCHIDKMKMCESDIKKQAKELAYSLKVQNIMSSDHDHRDRLDVMWREWVNSLQTNGQNEGPLSTIDETFQRILFEELKEESALLQECLETTKLSSPIRKLRENFHVSKRHISIKPRYIYSGDKSSFLYCKEIINEKIQRLFDDIEKLLEGLQGASFSSENVEMVIQKPLSMAKELNESDLPFKLENRFKVELSVFICRYAIPIFKIFSQKETNPKANELASLLKRQNVYDFDLDRKFNEMWTSWINKLRSMEDDHSSDMERIVREILFENLQNESQFLREYLEKYKLSSPVQKMIGNFHIFEEHISMKSNKFLQDKTNFSYVKEELDKEILLLFEDIQDYLSSLQGLRFTRGQIEMVIKKPLFMTNKINESKLPFTLTHDFRVQLTVFICRYAIPVFKNIELAYQKETEPKALIHRKYREQFLELFKSIYKDTKNEILFTDMASCLKNAIDQAVMEKTLAELANDIRENNSFPNSKTELLKTVLKDLLKKKSFDEYLSFVKDVKEFLREWIKNRVNKYIFERKTSKYAELAEKQIKLLIEDIKQEVEHVTQDPLCQGDLNQWLERFLDRVKGKLTLSVKDMPLMSENTCNVVSFKTHLITKLDAIREDLNQRASSVSAPFLEQKRGTLYTRMENQCIGCCEQCPFCKAPCSLTDLNHTTKHRALQHYPKGVRGMKTSITNKLSTETCSMDVSTDRKFKNANTNFEFCLYKDYKKIYPKWDIKPDRSMKASLYWKWFMAKFSSQLAKAYDAKEPDIPRAWKCITEREALASLEE